MAVQMHDDRRRDVVRLTVPQLMSEPTDREKDMIGKSRTWLEQSGVKESDTHTSSLWSVCLPWFGFYPFVLCCAVLCCAV